MTTNITCCVFVILIFAFLIVFIVTNCIMKEGFTAPGLTLTIPPSWFPQNSAKPYKKSEWMTKMYLDRYPFHTNTGKGYISYDESNRLASTDRFWRF